jgi:phage shock protein C
MLYYHRIYWFRLEEVTMAKKLHRSRTDRKLWGVCGGIAQHFDIDPTLVRIITVVSVFFTGVGLIAYIIAAIVLPVEGE